MDCQKYTTIMPERKRGQHLQREDRGAIQSLVRQGLSGRAIAKELNCSPTTISNELKRGTPPRKSNKGRAPVTPQSVERRFTEPTERTPRSPTRLLSVAASSTGSPIKFGLNIGLSTPVWDMPDFITCSRKMR